MHSYSPKDKRIHQMLRADYRESISQTVSGIRDTPSLEGRSKAAIAQAVVLRLPAAAGWDVFDLSQVMPATPPVTEASTSP